MGDALRRLQGARRAPALSVADAPTRTRNLGLILGVAVGVAALDQITKSWAVSALADGPVQIIGEFAQLRLTRNSGAAFSSFRGATPLLAALAIVVSIVLLRTASRAHDLWLVAGLTLVLGGALGNLADRVFRAPGFGSGRVVDFVDVGRWPVFNVADAAISIGAVIVIVRSLRPQSGRQE